MTCDYCGRAHEPTWADERFGCKDENGKRRVPLNVKISYTLQGKDGQGHDYREDLARNTEEIAADPNRPSWWRPGMPDPEAYVDGPRAVAKLLDKRKREGWEINNNLWDQSLQSKNEDEMSSDEIMAEAFRRAAESGFTEE